MSLAKDTTTGARGVGARLLRSPERMTERQRLTAPRPEAPPTWSLSACKGLHKTAAAECRLPPLFSDLGGPSAQALFESWYLGGAWWYRGGAWKASSLRRPLKAAGC